MSIKRRKNMFYCRDCGHNFDKPDKIFENHKLNSPPFEKMYICPNCKSSNIKEKAVRYCRYCGKTLKKDVGNYCNEACRTAGEKLWNKQLCREAKEYSSELNLIVRETEKYNKTHITKLSYGQYVAFHLKKVKK